MQQHQLALSVYNDSATYKTRVESAASLSAKRYAQYLRELILAEADKQRRQFQVRSRQPDIEQACVDLGDLMREHMAELEKTYYELRALALSKPITLLVGVEKSPRTEPMMLVGQRISEGNRGCVVFTAQKERPPSDSAATVVFTMPKTRGYR